MSEMVWIYAVEFSTRTPHVELPKYYFIPDVNGAILFMAFGLSVGYLIGRITK